MIGIIGGNGVAATNRLLSIIEEKVTKSGAFRDCQHPEMLVWQLTKAPSRSMYLEGRGESFVDDYVKCGKQMLHCGVTKLAMCCNTAHYAVDELEHRIGLPFINLLDEVCNVISSKGYVKVGLMVTDGARKFRLYDNCLEKTDAKAKFVYPDPDFQKKVTEGICNAKNIKRFYNIYNEEHPIRIFTEVVNHLIAKGCDCVVAGCTDIRNVYYPENVKCGYIDSLETLADAIIRESK